MKKRKGEKLNNVINLLGSKSRMLIESEILRRESKLNPGRVAFTEEADYGDNRPRELQI